jgi:hypothetical protein
MVLAIKIAKERGEQGIFPGFLAPSKRPTFAWAKMAMAKERGGRLWNYDRSWEVIHALENWNPPILKEKAVEAHNRHVYVLTSFGEKLADRLHVIGKGWINLQKLIETEGIDSIIVEAYKGRDVKAVDWVPGSVGFVDDPILLPAGARIPLRITHPAGSQSLFRSHEPGSAILYIGSPTPRSYTFQSKTC